MTMWIGVMVDGCLATRVESEDEAVFGTPVQVMLGRVRSWLASGQEVRVVTGRHPEYVRAWLAAQGLPASLPVTDRIDRDMTSLWGSDVVQVVTDRGIPIAG
jgi:hypothetical protein